MDPRTGDSKPRKQATDAQPGATGKPQAGKLKSVTLSVEWGYDLHSLTIGPRNWKKIQAGKPHCISGESYDYEGGRFHCYWDFNGRGQPGSLIVGYGNDGAEGYVGTWQDALDEEHQA